MPMWLTAIVVLIAVIVVAVVMIVVALVIYGAAYAVFESIWGRNGLTNTRSHVRPRIPSDRRRVPFPCDLTRGVAYDERSELPDARRINGKEH